MKKNYIVFLILFVSKIFSQQAYVLDTRIETFQYLTTSTVIGSSFNSTLNLPFSFSMSGPNTTATVNNTTDGYINFGADGIVSMAANMGAHSSRTQCGYEVSGTSPGRILKLEWRAQGFPSSPAPDDSLTYQVWLYESTHVIEWHFGPNAWYMGSFGSNTPLVIIDYGSSYYTIAGTVNSPTLLNCFTACHLNGLPASGKVYRLVPSAIATQKELANQDLVQVFPNPSNGSLTIAGITNKSQVTITEASGKVLYERTISEETEVDPGLAGGVYFLMISSAGGVVTRKICIVK